MGGAPVLGSKFANSKMSVRDEYNERFAFVVDWFDHAAGLVRKYQLLYYPKDSQIEMVSDAGMLLLDVSVN